MWTSGTREVLLEALHAFLGAQGEAMGMKDRALIWDLRCRVAGHRRHPDAIQLHPPVSDGAQKALSVPEDHWLR